MINDSLKTCPIKVSLIKLQCWAHTLQPKPHAQAVANGSKSFPGIMLSLAKLCDHWGTKQSLHKTAGACDYNNILFP